MTRKFIAMVPARAGSQGLRDKNIRPLAGKPLMAHSIRPALECRMIDQTFINSDSDTYLEIGKAAGAMTYRRPDHLGQSDTTMQAVVAEFIETRRREGDEFDAVLVLYPTYPFRTPELLEDLLRYYLDNPDCHSVIGLKQPDTHPFLCAKRETDGSIKTFVEYDGNKYYRRQDYPECFELTSWAMVISADHVDMLNAHMMSPETVGYAVPDTVRIVDIDTEIDFYFAEFLMEKNYL
ncbi:cytidylyltransferase domain-containing protein [Roseibium sp.]|uniref:acylneuraminate cytidylyltransferase family protein n=1 Tax=Roseibium sp. TaxID=1936156 RepID=UPI003B503421